MAILNPQASSFKLQASSLKPQASSLESFVSMDALNLLSSPHDMYNDSASERAPRLPT